MRDSRRRRIAIIGAASSIGIRPYDHETAARHLDQAPGVLRKLGLVDRLAADDLGDVKPPAYRDFSRPPGGIRNEREVAEYSRSLADHVASGLAGGRFAVVIGGDCSIVLGSLQGAARGRQRIGLAYVDAHADFGTPQESLTGSAASMCLALAVGRGDSPLAALADSKPLVRPADVALIGRRDEGETYYGHAALATSGILDMPGALLSGRPSADVAKEVLDRLESTGLDGFWIHVDADVIDPQVMPAVDSPVPGGPGIDELVGLIAPLVQHPRALGLQITIYDPSLDADGSCGSRLVTLLEQTLARV